MTRTVNRLCQFGMADWWQDELSVRTAVAPLGERHLRRLSGPLLEVHNTLVRRLAADHHYEATNRTTVLRTVPDPVSPAPTSGVSL
jgi:hypothetical protein